MNGQLDKTIIIYSARWIAGHTSKDAWKAGQIFRSVGGNMGESFPFLHTLIGASWLFLLRICLCLKKATHFSVTERHIGRHTPSFNVSLSWSNPSHDQYNKGQRYSYHSWARSLCLLCCVAPKPRMLPLAIYQGKEGTVLLKLMSCAYLFIFFNGLNESSLMVCCLLGRFLPVWALLRLRIQRSSIWINAPPDSCNHRPAVVIARLAISQVQTWSNFCLQWVFGHHVFGCRWWRRWEHLFC